MFMSIYRAIILLLLIIISVTTSMTSEEKNELRLQVLDMFKHGFGSYMKYAFPADELMPLSCKGRYRGSEPSRGDIDDALGNFSLTLVDSLDSLAVLGMFDEFEHAVRQVIQHVSFDRDVVVSVFETNIRMIGGLLGGHISAKYIHSHHPLRLSWYRDELLVLAHDLALRLLPAFNTTSGLPLPRVNLRYGIDLTLSKSERERFTCTACAGTLILEWATLSRLTGNHLFEQYADRALSYLWERRNRRSNLMGTILNVHSGDWLVHEAGIGAGIDSYYEYLFKAYVLLGEKNNNYLNRFQEHYSSIMSYVQRGVAMVNVHMNQPFRSSRNHMDALLAFWPGLQVMTGDLKSAIELHEMLYQVVKKHKFLPEAFTTDYRIHWNSHPLRPEFVESTYFLYKATGDPHYLEVGRTILNNLEEYARVPCGYAALSDVSTSQKEDRMDSFVLAETFKYLYLLYESPSSHFIDIEQFLFTTEAHLIPLNLLLFKNLNQTLKTQFKQLTLNSIYRYEQNNLSKFDNDFEGKETINQCPAMDEQFQSHRYKEQLRDNIRQNHDMTETKITTPKEDFRSFSISSHRLTALEFSPENAEHIVQLKQMGIRIQSLLGGQIQLIHMASTAESIDDAENGLIFMREMLELMKTTSSFENSNHHLPLTVIPLLKNSEKKLIRFTVGTAQFGKQLHQTQGMFAQLSIVQPFSACSKLQQSIQSRFGILRRGDCMFIEKARYLEQAHASGGIVLDYNLSLNSSYNGMFSMTGDGNNNVSIPLVLMFKEQAYHLLNLVTKSPNLIVYIGEEKFFRESFYQQLDYLENFIRSRRYVYGVRNDHQCSIISKQLKILEAIVNQPIETNYRVNSYHIALEKLISTALSNGKKPISLNITSKSEEKDSNAFIQLITKDKNPEN